jgi:hypothetical protein
MNKQLSALNIHPRSEYDSAMISWFNSLRDMDKNINLKLFCSSFDVLHSDKKFPILPIHEAKYQHGNFFVWDILSLELAIDFPNINKIYYFQNDNLPWTKAFNINYTDWANLYDNQKVDIITNNTNVKEIFELTWKKINLVEVTTESLYEIV